MEVSVEITGTLLYPGDGESLVTRLAETPFSVTPKFSAYRTDVKLAKGRRRVRVAVPGYPLTHLPEILSIVIKASEAIGGILLKELISQLIKWFRERSKAIPPTTVNLYGPDGTVVKIVE